MYPEENWCIEKGVDQNGDVVFITINLGYQGYLLKEQFPWLLWVNITTEHQNESGHPTEDEATILNNVEDVITSHLADHCKVQYIGRVTKNGFRELIYFVDDPEKANQTLTLLTEQQNLREWEYEMKRDAEWSYAEQYLAGEHHCL
jgi:hypothetical protein